MADSSSIQPLRIFLSYSSAQHTIAEQVYLAMTTSGHDVFFDRTDLPVGREYNQAILDRIRSSDLMVFLISPESIADGAYTRTELRFARDTWPNPEGHVLPVLVAPTNFSDIPNFLKAVTILRPEGNHAAEISGIVNDIATGRIPEDTIAGKAEVIDRLATEAEALRRAQRIEAIKRQWADKKDLLLGSKVNGQHIEPSEDRLFFYLAVSFVMSLFFWASTGA